MIFRHLLLSLLWALLLWLPVARPLQAEPIPNAPLTFSLVPEKNIEQQIRNLQPLLDLLEQKLQRPVRVIRAHSYQAVIEGLLAHNLDLAILGPASYARARLRDPGIEPFASFSQKKGLTTPEGSYYQSILFSLKARQIASVQQLKGRKIALTDPASTSGCLIPNMEFTQVIDGTPLPAFFGTLIYTGAHDRSIQAVLDGRADAAFVASTHLDQAIGDGKIAAEQIALLWRSRPIHYDPFVFASHVPPALRQQIRAILLTPRPELAALFEQMPFTGIEPVQDSDYAPIHALVRIQSSRQQP
ncbi:MAG: phosphate/phosphite/phosphonate ABC transporter substrate-binding protein [Desulfuromonadaceae bacterium]|nr:phosphate/phosphite/phosphonate ABC transporter substrate-binding protein [Desulfuromonadaceae bacterium]